MYIRISRIEYIGGISPDYARKMRWWPTFRAILTKSLLSHAKPMETIPCRPWFLIDSGRV